MRHLWGAGAAGLLCVGGSATAAFGETPCITDYSADCVVAAAADFLEENIDWADPDSYKYLQNEIGLLAVAEFLIGQEEKARDLMAKLSPREIESFFLHDLLDIRIGASSEVFLYLLPLSGRGWVADSALSSLEARNQTRVASSLFYDWERVVSLFLSAGDLEKARQIAHDAVTDFLAALDAGDMDVLPAAEQLFSAAWSAGAQESVDRLLDVLSAEDMAHEGVSPAEPLWTNEKVLETAAGRFLHQGDEARAEEIWRAAGVRSEEEIAAALRRARDGREERERETERDREFARLVGDPSLGPGDIVTHARALWPDLDEPGFELWVFSQIIRNTGDLAAAMRFLDAYPDQIADLLRRLPAISLENWESWGADCGEGFDCIGRVSRIVSDPSHRRAICDYVAGRADTVMQVAPADENEFADLVVIAVWAAQFCEPATATGIIGDAEALVPQIEFSDLGGILVVYAAIASYATGDVETGERILGILTRGDDEGLAVLQAMVADHLVRLGQRDKAEPLLHQSWQVLAPLMASTTDRQPPSFIDLMRLLAMIADDAATLHWLGEQTQRQ